MSPRWILISFLMIGGGVALALGALVAAWVSSGTLDPAMVTQLLAAAESGDVADVPALSIANVEIATALAYASGAAFGAFFAARASPHRSFLEPAVAAGLVVGSLLLILYSTPMGKLAVSLTRDHLERLASILVAVGIVAALLGAVLGELASFGTRRVGVIRQTGVSLLLAIGAVWLSAVLMGMLLANEIAEQAMANLGAQQAGVGDGPIVEVSRARAVTVAGLALLVAAVSAGFAGELAARTRAVVPVSVAGVLVFGAVGGLSALIPQISTDAVPFVMITGGAAGGLVAGLTAWLTGWIAARLTRRAT